MTDDTGMMRINSSPLAVLLVIGNLYLGPFIATETELGEWAAVRADMVVESTGRVTSYRSSTGRCPGDCRAMMNSDHQMLCRRVMAQIGIGWRMGIDGSVGWMTSTEREWSGVGSYKSVEVRCMSTDPIFRSRREDAGRGDEVKPGVFSR